MVSLPLSFLSLAWASTVDYEVLHSDGHFRVKDKVLIFSTHLFILSIRLFAVAWHCKLQVVGYQCFDPSLYGDNDL